MNGAHVAGIPDVADLTDADKWILGRLEQVRAAVDDYLDCYQFAKANEALYQFTWNEFCDWYLEIAKVQPGEVTQRVLGYVLDTLLRLLHPTMPFVTETLWRALTDQESLNLAAWPTPSGIALDDTAARRVADVEKLVTEIRRFRSDQGVKPSQKVPAQLDFAAVDLDGQEHVVRSLARVTAPEAGFATTAAIEVRLSVGTVVVALDTSGTVDKAAERKRLEKDLAAQQKELDSTSKKLANEAFLAKAPAAVVAKITERQRIATEEVARISARLRELEG